MDVNEASFCDLYHWTITGDVSVTLTANTCQSANHAGPSICIALEGNGSRPSHQGGGYSEDGRMFTLNTIEKHAVCYAIEGNVVDRESAKNGKGWCEDVSPTLNTQDKHSVCYAIENHPCDSRVTIDDSGIVQTLNARMGTGGGNTPMILMALGGTDLNASVTDGTVSPCVLARAGTGGGNEPIVLMDLKDTERKRNDLLDKAISLSIYEGGVQQRFETA